MIRCQRRVLAVARTHEGGIGVYHVRCKGTLDSSLTCDQCKGVRGSTRRNATPLVDRFLARVTLLEEAAQQYLDATATAAESEEAEALRFALKQVKEPQR
jgi:hypothetical protein